MQSVTLAAPVLLEEAAALSPADEP
jgi:hypothetical protein